MERHFPELSAVASRSYQIPKFKIVLAIASLALAIPLKPEFATLKYPYRGYLPDGGDPARLLPLQLRAGDR